MGRGDFEATADKVAVEKHEVAITHEQALDNIAPFKIEAVTSHADEELVAEAEVDFDWTFDVYINLVTLTITYLAVVWQQSALPLSLPYIVKAFPDDPQTSWVATTPGLVLCVLSLFVGELSDIFGRRWFLITADALLIIGTLVAARAQQVPTIIGGQVITGIGIAIGYISSPALIECVPKRHRSVITGITASIITVTIGVLGIAIGAFTKYGVGGPNNGWRMGPYLGAGVAFIAMVLAFFFYHPSHRPNPGNLTVWERLRRIDWIGVVLGCGGLVLLLLGLQFGGSSYPWKSARILSFIIVGGVLLIIFAVWEAKFVGFGLFPRAMFGNRNFAIILTAQLVEGMGIFTTSAFLTQEQFDVYTSDPIMAQVRCLPANVLALLGALIAAIIVFKTREAKWVAIGALVLATLAAMIFSFNRVDSNYGLWFLPAFFMGIAVTSMGVSVQVIATVCTPNQLIGTASVLCNSFRGLGGAIGIVIFSQVLEAKIKVYLPKYLAEAALGAGLPLTSLEPLLVAFTSGDTAAIEKIPGVTEAVLAALQTGSRFAYSKSFSYMWYSMIPFAALGTFVVAFLKPTKPYTTMEVASPVQQRFSTRHAEDKLGELEEAKV